MLCTYCQNEAVVASDSVRSRFGDAPGWSDSVSNPFCPLVNRIEYTVRLYASRIPTLYAGRVGIYPSIYLSIYLFLATMWKSDVIHRSESTKRTIIIIYLQTRRTSCRQALHEPCQPTHSVSSPTIRLPTVPLY